MKLRFKVLGSKVQGPDLHFTPRRDWVFTATHLPRPKRAAQPQPIDVVSSSIRLAVLQPAALLLCIDFHLSCDLTPRLYTGIETGYWFTEGAFAGCLRRPDDRRL